MLKEQDRQIVIQNSPSIKKIVRSKSSWWEKPLDTFTERLQALHTEHYPYFTRQEAEQIHNDVYKYTHQRAAIWANHIAQGLSPEYLEYLKKDLDGYLDHVIRFVTEDILDRKGENKLPHKPTNDYMSVCGTAS